MKPNSAKEVWIARIIAWVVVGAISCGIIFVTTFMLGPSLFAVPNLSDKIAVAAYCPGAESICPKITYPIENMIILS